MIIKRWPASYWILWDGSPDEGDVVEFRDLKFTVMAMSGVKIEEVELRKTVADHPEADR